MFNLVKNELIKIFSKKAIYVILIIFLLLSIASVALNKVIENISNVGYNYIDQELSIMKESVIVSGVCTFFDMEHLFFSSDIDNDVLSLFNSFANSS